MGKRRGTTKKSPRTLRRKINIARGVAVGEDEVAAARAEAEGVVAAREAVAERAEADDVAARRKAVAEREVAAAKGIEMRPTIARKKIKRIRKTKMKRKRKMTK